MPPVFHLQKVPELPTLLGQFFHPSPIQCPHEIVVRLFRRQLNRHINVAQPLHLGIEHASEKYDPGHLSQKIGVLLNPPHALKEPLQRPLRGRTCDPFGCRCRRERLSGLRDDPSSTPGDFDQSRSA